MALVVGDERAVRDFGIWSAATGGLVGNVEVRVLDDELVNLSYLVFPEWRRRGVATRAARLALEYATRRSSARAPARIEVLTDNTASLGVVRGLGAVHRRATTDRQPLPHVHARTLSPRR